MMEYEESMPEIGCWASQIKKKRTAASFFVSSREKVPRSGLLELGQRPACRNLSEKKSLMRMVK